ncbi:MAG: ornithine cyclodeaminase family protein, partial [Deltaproteobacteria bacterium]
RMYAALFDTESGELLAFMGFPFGTLRTAAHVAVAAKHMAREDAERLGLFGVGRNALGILKGLVSVRPIKEIFVSSRDPERRKKFCAEAGQQLGIEARPVQNPEEAVRGMDVILTATNSLTPIFPESWVEPGTHVSSMGKPTELSRGLHLKANRIVVGSQEQERNYNDRSAALPLVELTAEGKLSWSRIPELGELVSEGIAGWIRRHRLCHLDLRRGATAQARARDRAIILRHSSRQALSSPVFRVSGLAFRMDWKLTQGPR